MEETNLGLALDTGTVINRHYRLDRTEIVDGENGVAGVGIQIEISLDNHR